MAVLKPMLKLALLPLLLLLILAQWVGIFLTTFSTILTNLLAGLFFFVALTSWVMKLADGGEVLKMLITAFVVFVLPYIAIAAIAKISFFADELRDFLQSLVQDRPVQRTAVFFVTSGLHRAGPFLIRRNKPMKLTFEEKKLLYTYGCADLELTRKRLCGVAGLTVDPDQNKLVLDFCRKLEDETLADWYDQMFYFVRSEMEHYTMMQKMSQDIVEDEDWGPTIFDESEEEELIDDV